MTTLLKAKPVDTAMTEMTGEGGMNAPEAPSTGLFGLPVEVIDNTPILRKATLMQEADAKLQEAKALFDKGEGYDGQAKEMADDAAMALYHAEVEGLSTKAETSAKLGDVFGFAITARTGKPSKTPAGKGSDIRKRIVRAVAAVEYVNRTEESDGYFAGLPEDEIQQISVELENGHCGFWAAYERFAKVKADHAVKLEQAYDAKHILKLANTLANDLAAAAKAGRDNPALLQAYQALHGAIEAVATTYKA